MEKYIIDKDIRTACVTAVPFPEGIEDAFQKLHSVYPAQDGKEVLWHIISRRKRELDIQSSC